jgi:hypothetical protein
VTNYWLADFLSELENKEMTNMPKPELEYANAMLAIVAKYGKLSNNDGKGIWVGYTPAEKNDNQEIGVMCANCYFSESENVCRIVAQEIEPGGLCRLAAIPDGLVKDRS